MIADRHPLEPDDPETTPVIRPFLLTGGRTRPARDGLRIETLIQARTLIPQGIRFEARRIATLCQRPTSVAEISAAVGVPIGVARILVADLVEDGVVTAVEPGTLSVSLIERIRDRVREL